MNEALIPQYIANAIAVARADETTTDSERAAIEKICAGVGGTEEDIEQAEELLADEDFAPTMVGRFSDRVRNIEDMIYVSLSDGSMGEEEIARIVPFIKELGLGQALADVLVNEVRTMMNTE